MLRNRLSRLLQPTITGKPIRTLTVTASHLPVPNETNAEVASRRVISNSHLLSTHLQDVSLYHCSRRYLSSDGGFFKRTVRKMGILRYSKAKLKRSGFVLYSNMLEKVRVDDFFEVCDLPDTFYSWFLVTELHIWMLMVRLMAEGEEGRFTRNALIEALWEDADARSKKLGAASLSIRKEQMESINSSFQAALFAYDEALVEDDRVLASALWRRLFSQTCNDPERLECCVQYVRKQIALLDSLSREDFMLDCKVQWVPLLERDS